MVIIYNIEYNVKRILYKYYDVGSSFHGQQLFDGHMQCVLMISTVVVINFYIQKSIHISKKLILFRKPFSYLVCGDV